MTGRSTRRSAHHPTVIVLVILVALALAGSIATLATAASASPVTVYDWQSGNAASECAQAGCNAEFAHKFAAEARHIPAATTVDGGT